MLLAATLLAFAAATITAWLVVRKRWQYLPIAALLTLGIVGDLLGELIRRSYLDAQPRPYLELPARALYHVEQALFLAWPAGVVAVALKVLGGRVAWYAIAAWIVAVLVHVIGYPTLREDTLALALRFEQGIAVAALAWCAVAWSVNDRAREPEHAAAIVLAIAEASVLLFVHTARQFELWAVAQALYLNVFAMISVGQVRWLCKTR